jgi:hypothetical protein
MWEFFSLNISGSGANRRTSEQGCQMVCFQTKNPNLGKFWRVLQWEIFIYFMIIWSILRPLEIFYGHLVYFVVIWYISRRFGILYQEKSGNPASELPFFEVRRKKIIFVCITQGVVIFYSAGVVIFTALAL